MKTRIIHTKFWNDSFIEELSPIEKLLFVYLLTNDAVNIIFCYECSDKRITYDTGCNREQLEKFKEKMTNSGKMYFKDGFVFLKNAIKYEEYKGELHDKARENILKAFNSEIKNWYELLLLDKPPLSPLKEGLKGTETINHNKESINNNKEIIKHKPLISEEEKELLINVLVEKGMNKDLVVNEINKFINYWTEKNLSGTKERWQLEKTFEVKRRLQTWFGNINKFRGVKNDKQFIDLDR